MNAILTPDCLIALGIKHQIRYPLYYIKKVEFSNVKRTRRKNNGAKKRNRKKNLQIHI